jgi:hypothetical protein
MELLEQLDYYIDYFWDTAMSGNEHAIYLIGRMILRQAQVLCLLDKEMD